MSPSLTDIDLETATAAGKTIEIRGYVLSPRLQVNLERVLQIVLRHYKQDGLFPVVYAVVQELALWASLANMRQIFFEERGGDLNLPADLKALESAFQASLNAIELFEYRRKIRARGLFLAIRIVHSLAGLRFEIENNAVHSAALEERLRGDLRQAMQYSNIMEYFRDNPEDQDGRNVGIAFSILMLKEEQLRPELMRLGHKEGGQISRLEIPFDKSFQSIRDRILNDEMITPFGGRDLFPPDRVVQPVQTVVCPVCENIVDERIFFPDVDPGMLDEERVAQVVPHWRPVDGACASCIATYDPERPPV